MRFDIRSGTRRPEFHISPNARWALCVVALLCIASFPLATGSVAGDPQQRLGPSVDPLTSRYPAALQATLEAFGKGVAQLETGGFASALASFPDPAAARSTEVEDYILLHKGRAQLESDHAADALGFFRTLRSRFPDSPVRGESDLGEVQALLKLHDHAAALALLEGIQDSSSAKALWLRGQALEEAGKPDQAIQLYLRIYTESVSSEPSISAEGRLRALAPDFQVRTPNQSAMIRRGENLLQAGRSREARTLFQRLVSRGVSNQRTAELNVLLAEVEISLKRPSEATRYLARAAGSYLADRAAYLEATCFRSLGKEAALLEVRDRALTAYPQSPYTEKLLYSVAVYYDVDGRVTAALNAFQALVRAFPQGEHIEIAHWKVALLSYVEQRYEDALRGFWSCFLANPSTAAASAPAYWIGRCCQHLGCPEEAAYFFARARAFSNHNYYGQRAQEAISGMPSLPRANPASPAPIDFEPMKRRLDALRTEPVVLPPPSGTALRVLERARQLSAAGLPDFALLELNHGRNRLPEDGKSLAYGISRICESKNDYLGAIINLRRVFPGYLDLLPAMLPDEVWNLLFPTRYSSLVTESASRNNLDPSLILAMIRQESAFQESARSAADARGLLQVLPATGRAVARQTGLRSYTTSRLYHPETNIALGTQYFSSLIRKYDGRVELALAAYNAGSARVDRWLKQFADADMAEFVERIPFAETRSYVKQVLSTQAHYRYRTTKSFGSSPSGFAQK